MSQENVDLLRTADAEASARAAEGMLEFATDDVVWISDPRFPGGGTYEGKPSVRRWLDQLWIYDELSIEVEEIIDLGEDRALGITRCHGHSADGPKAEWVWCHLVAFSAGRIVQAQSFLDKDSALAAAGVTA